MLSTIADFPICSGAEGIHRAIFGADNDHTVSDSRRSSERFADFVRPQFFSLVHAQNVDPAILGTKCDLVAADNR